jgi:VIT1/CCC1 family predicted Fe2+/Mn2+ transporter
LREEISRTSRQLVLRSPRYLIRGKIGKEILTEAVTGTTISVFAGFGGSLIPLLSSVYISGSGYFPVILAISALALLGGGIGKSVSGNYVFWVLTLVIIGILVTIVGNYLNLV